MTGPINWQAGDWPTENTTVGQDRMLVMDTYKTDEPAIAYTEYRFDCPECGVVNDCGSKDPSGSTLDCLHCNVRVEVR